MISRPSLTAVAGGLLALGLVAGTGTASAQTSNHGRAFGAALKGTIQSVGSTTFQLKSSTGTVTTVSFTAQTRVEKIVAGTTADLAAKARISLQLQAGTTTVTSVMVEPAFTKPATGAAAGTTRTRPVHTRPVSGTTTGTGTTTRKKPATGTAKTFAGGQVVSLSGNSLMVSGRGGTTATYTLASNVKISKTVAGTTHDLAQGESVTVFAPATEAAREITILAS